MASTIRFHPPRIEVPPEVRWMLLRAFGPPGAPFPAAGEPPLAPAAVLAAARRFEVSARIGARQGRARLSGELAAGMIEAAGAESAAGFQRDQAAAAALGLRLLALAGEVAAAAAPLGIPLAFLKFAALEAAGFTALGARSACDIDVLVPEERADDLQRALLARGWRLSGMPPSEHQLAPVEHPYGGIVEVHRMVLGVRLDGGASATLEALAASGLLRPDLPDLPGSCSTPAAEVLAAHALVHGIGQHGYWPASYSLLKMIADLIDLGFHEDGALAARAAALVARDVTAAEAAAVRSLCGALAAGTDLLAAGDGSSDVSPALLLLRHILAGRLDAEYAAALRLGFFRSQPSDRGPAERLLRSTFSAVFLTRGQIDAIYGPPRGSLGYLGRRLARPFDLLRRLGGYVARTVRLRSDRPRGGS
jgi:hypothetical protein